MGFFRSRSLPGPDLRCAIEEMATSEVFAHLEPSEDSDLGTGAVVPTLRDFFFGTNSTPQNGFWELFHPT